MKTSMPYSNLMDAPITIIWVACLKSESLDYYLHSWDHEPTEEEQTKACFDYDPPDEDVDGPNCGIEILQSFEF